MVVRRLAGMKWSGDLAAVVCLLVLAGTVAYRHLGAHFDFSYRDCSEDLLYPCVGRFGWTIKTAPLEASPHWQAFVQRKIDAIDCAALRDLPRVDAGHTWELQRYLHATLSGLFQLSGPRRSVFVNYLTVMFVFTALASYGLFRLGASPAIAALASLPMIFSELHLRNLIHPIEYAKAPFILACLFFLGLIVRHRFGPRGLAAVAAACGVSVGLGIGFKPDVLICLPVAVVAIAAFAPSSYGPRLRALAIAAFLAGVFVSGWPMLKAQFLEDSGSLLPVQVLGGTARTFGRYYAQPALYDDGVLFDDLHITLLINSYNQRVHGSNTFAVFYSKEMQTAAALLYADVLRAFPADFLLRTWAGVINILELSRVGVLTAAVVVPVLLVANVRLGGCVLFLLVTAVAYVSLVFQSKHFFHLEWVPWWFVAVAVQAACSLLAVAVRGVSPAGAARALRRSIVARTNRIVALAVVVLALAATFMLVRQYQQRRMIALLKDSTQPDALERLITVSEAGGDGSTRVTPMGLGAAPHPTPLLQDYLVLDVQCSGPDDAQITGVYEQASTPREGVTVPCSIGPRHWMVFWAVYQQPPVSSFRWFESARDVPVRINAIRRVKDLASIPLLLKMTVPDDFRRRVWYQTLLPDFYSNSSGVAPYLLP